MAADASGPPRRLLQRVRRGASRLSVRLVAFNLVLVLVPLGGAFFFGLHELMGRYERHLLEAQERSMAQQGRLLAAALAESSAAAGGGAEAGLGARGAEQILAGLEQRITARLRVWDGDGLLLADSSRLGPRRDQIEAGPGDGRAGGAAPEESWLYRLGAAPFRLWNRLSRPEAAAGGGPPEPTAPEPAPSDAPPEVRAALEGRYGAAVRPTPGDQRSVTLHVAIPVRVGDRVLGAAQASQSTYRILQDLRGARLAFFRVFLASIAVAVLLSLALAATISRPVRRLRAEAATLVDRRGRLRGTFSGSHHQDEIGDLARALEGLSRRVEDHVRFVEAFAADVSHEFKNPLTSIRAATEMLSEAGDREERPEERRRLLATVEGEVARMERLLTAVREISLIDSRLEEEATGPQDLGALLEALVEGVSLRAPNGVGVELGLPGEERLTVRGSADRLVQAFENLLENALGLAPAGSSVRIDLARQGTEVVATVRDRGPGIPPEHLGRVFDRFFSYRPGGPGDGGPGSRHSGLGLAIVKAVVEGYGGSVRARNRESGGALFEVRLPLAPPDDAPNRR